METLNVNYEIGTDRFLGRAQLVYYPLPELMLVIS